MRHIPIITALLTVGLLWGCGQKASEDQAPAADKPSAASQEKAFSEAKAATIAELLSEPKAYAGKDVSVKGVFSGICCESDWFLKDGMDTIEVYSTKMCPMPSKSKIQAKVLVIGTVMVRNDHPAITAKEVRFE